MDKEKLQELADKARVRGEKLMKRYQEMLPHEQQRSTEGFDGYVESVERDIKQYQNGEELLEFAQNAVKGLRCPFMYSFLLGDIRDYLEEKKGGEQMTHDEFNKRIKQEVAEYLDIPESEVFIVWNCKTLQNSKALVSALGKGVPYFEFTLNGDKGEIYMDVYDKRENKVLTEY